jgi:D-alanine-D-alanine ligase
LSGKLTVGVIFGGRSGEHEISLMSARSVLGALDPDRYRIVQIGITRQGSWLTGENVLEALEGNKLEGLDVAVILGQPGLPGLYRWRKDQAPSVLSQLDVVFPVLHGTFGEDGTLQGLLEMAEIAYVGAGVLASSVAMDKGLFKQVMVSKGIPVVDYVVLSTTQFDTRMEDSLKEAESIGPYPLFTKPANMGSSVGVSKCANRSLLVEGLMEAARYDRRVLVEQGLQAREIEVSVLGNEEPEASIVGEIVPGDEFYSYEAKYIHDTSELLIPAPIDQEMAEEVRRLAVESFKAVDGAGMARVDFLLDKPSGKLYLNEINTIPGFTRISMYPKLWQASGVSYPELMDRLIELALQRQEQKARLVRVYGGSA